MDKTQSVIKQLKTSKLYAECHSCECEFKLSEAILFDGTKAFPSEALEVQGEMNDSLKEWVAELKQRKINATKKAAVTTRAVNIGKKLETVFPTMKDFKWNLADARVLGDPIDLITFNGYSSGKIKSLSFIEVKSGKARLNNHQKAVRDAIEDHKVRYKEFR